MALDRSQAPSVFEAAETREPIILADTAEDSRGGLAATRFGTRSLLTIPLIIHGEVSGVLSLHWGEPSADVTSPRLLLFARKLGSALSLALANAQLYEGEHRVAEILQSAMAASVETVSDVEVGSVYRSAPGVGSIGGDFYDVFDLPNGHVAFLLGDVSGKGIEAAATNALTRSTIRALAYRNHDPGSVLAGANEALLRQLSDSEFVTAAFGVLDPASGTVEIALAGHPEPIVCGRPNLVPADSRNPPLAVLTGGPFETWRFTMACCDALVLFSDGIFEARRADELFGIQRVRDLLDTCGHETCQQIADRLLGEVERFSAGPLRDDVAILVLRPCTS
jgi:serine phosphatase RsbU (regulator of sigma subunit)